MRDNKKDASEGNYSVVLEKVGNQALMTTKTLMQTIGLGLSEAKKMVDKAPATVAEGIDSKKAIALKKELEALGNVVSVPGLEIPATTSSTTKKTTKEKKVTATKTETKSQTKKSGAKTGTTVKIDVGPQSDLVKALAKALEIVGKDGFITGERVCNLLSDLVPKLEKERRRVKLAYNANAVEVLLNETDKTFAINEAVKRMVDYSDIAEDVAKETILSIYRVLE